MLAAAAKLDYSPNLSAQAVARGTTTTVALLVADIADPYVSQIAAGVVREADRERLIVTVAATERDTARELELVRTLRGQRPRAMILAASRREGDPNNEALEAELRAYESNGGRVAFVAGADLPFRGVRLDDRQGADDLARELTALGYRRFAAIAATEGIRVSDERLAGFRAGVEATAGTIERVVRARFTRDGGYDGMNELIETGLDGVELVFAANDVMAVGALLELRRSGRRVPDDVAVVGFDDSILARHSNPPLTSVSQPVEKIGSTIARLLLEEIDDPRTARRHVVLPTRLVVRESSGGPSAD